MIAIGSSPSASTMAISSAPILPYPDPINLPEMAFVYVRISDNG
jgi:hypothetical protein